MAAIAWTEEAQSWLADIFEYIAADNPAAHFCIDFGYHYRANDIRKS